MRRNMAPHERRLWFGFLKDYPVRFTRQHIIGNYIADFYCAKAKLVIELDGSQHYMPEGEQYDAIRTHAIEKLNLHVMRFSNLEIDRYFEAVIQKIDYYVINGREL